MASGNHHPLFIVVSADEATKLDQHQAFTLDAFEDTRMQYICLHKDMQVAIETALRVKTKAAVEAATRPTTWYVLEASFPSTKLYDLVTADSWPRVEWCRSWKSFHLFGSVDFSELAAISWSKFTLAPVGVEQLLRHTRKNSIDEADDQGLTALHNAAYIGYPALIEALLDQDILQQVKIQDNYGDTPLHLAIARCNVASVQELLKHDKYAPNVDLRAKGDKSPLHVAAAKNCPPIIEALLQHPLIDAAPVDADGHTPVHWAAWHGSKAAVKKLLEDGRIREIVDHRNADGKNAAEIAEERGYTEVAAILRGSEDGNDIEASIPTAFCWRED